MARYVDVIAIAIIGCMAVGISWFWVEGLPECRGPAGSVTDWLQALGTVGGVLLAALAYLNWGEQERRRARANLATELVRNAWVCAMRIAEARSVFIVADFETPLDGLKALVKRRPLLDAMEAALKHLRGFTLETKQLLGIECEKAVLAIVELGREVTMAYSHLDYIHAADQDLFEEIVEEGGESALTHNLRIMGMVWDKKGREDYTKNNDPFAKRVELAMERIEGLLGKELRYGA